MTVRAHKPEFNFREKLKELDHSHIPYEKMPHGSIIQSSIFHIPAEVHFNSQNFVTGYTHPFKPRCTNSTLVHHFWSKCYLDNTTNNSGQDYRLLGGESNLDICLLYTSDAADE